MPGSPSNSSFIPKRGPATKTRRTTSRRIYVFTLISYILILASLLGAGAMFLYEKHMYSERDDVIASLHSAISSFNRSDLEEVKEFDGKLRQAKLRVDNSVNFLSLFTSLEGITIDTVQYERLNLERQGDNMFVLNVDILTDSFDSTIFQRDLFGDQEEFFSSMLVRDLNTSMEEIEREDEEFFVTSTGEPETLVTFTAEIEVPVGNVPFDPNYTTALLKLERFDEQQQSLNLEEVSVEDVEGELAGESDNDNNEI